MASWSPLNCALLKAKSIVFLDQIGAAGLPMHLHRKRRLVLEFCMMTDEFVAERSKARGLSENEYMAGNLLSREVTAEDVAQAFLAQAFALKTTADVTTVDGGNIAAALR